MRVRTPKTKHNAVPKPTKFRPEEYTFNVAWSEEDRSFIGRVVEFPSLAAHGATLEKALKEIRIVVGYVLDDLAAEGERIPEPLGKRRFSGKLNVRMPKDLHRRLAAESERQGISLNAWINAKLAMAYPEKKH
jgi:predicted HicB family RNase H-like nuclease